MSYMMLLESDPDRERFARLYRANIKRMERLAAKLLGAAQDTGALAIALAGGVAANSLLRCLVDEGGQKLGAKLYLPEMQFCGDNGAMVAAQGFYELTAGNVAGLTLNGLATLPIDYNSPA